MRIVIIGAGIAGLGATLAFARQGHKTVLIERDAAPPPVTADDSFTEWERPGVPQRRLVHGFLPLSRKLLMTHLPDVVERLVAAGAHHVDQLEIAADPERRPGDEALTALRCRRTVFEWLLRRTAATEARVTVATGAAVVGLLGGASAVTGVRLDSGAVIEADVVVDAAGRRTGIATWLGALGMPAPERHVTPCGQVYYTRFYRHRDDVLPIAHRVSLGYADANALAGDGNTFSLTFFPRAEEPGLRLLRNDAAFERAVAAIDGFRAWREGATPLAPVGAMGGLDDVLRSFIREGRPVAPGLIPIGDSLSHTNPTLARGMSLGLDQAFKAASVPWDDVSPEEGALAYHSAVDPLAEASYRDAASVDDLKRRLYAGDPNAAEEPPAIIIRALRFAAAQDPDLLRANFRKQGLLEAPGWIEGEPWLSRARALLAANPNPPPAGPDLQRMLAILGGNA